jgi:ABC-type antimicrobial peptide transport system permease subunit
VAIGAALGLAAAVGLGRGLRAFLYEVSPTDPTTYVAAVVLLVVAAAAAAWLAARRAAAIDPIAALR